MKLQIPMKMIALILFQCFTITMLFAHAPAQPDSSVAKFHSGVVFTATGKYTVEVTGMTGKDLLTKAGAAAKG